jgi:hypothetical protein
MPRKKPVTAPPPPKPLVAVSGGQFFDELLGDIQPTDRTRQTYPHFTVRVGVIYRRPPRHPYFEFTREMGSGLIPAVLAHRPLRDPADLAFVFPERHMNVAEQQQFMSRLNGHPDALAGKIKSVDLLTISPLIVGDFLREQIRIIRFDDDVDSWT